MGPGRRSGVIEFTSYYIKFKDEKVRHQKRIPAINSFYYP